MVPNENTTHDTSTFALFLVTIFQLILRLAANFKNKMRNSQVFFIFKILLNDIIFKALITMLEEPMHIKKNPMLTDI